MFVVIKYGDGKLVLFNPDCRVHVFDLWIKRVCKIPADTAIDLCDENGELKHVSGRDDLVSKFLVHRCTYIPVVIHKKENGRLDRIKPCLVFSETDYPRLAVQLGREVKTARSKDRIKRCLGKKVTSNTTPSVSRIQAPKGSKKKA